MNGNNPQAQRPQTQGQKQIQIKITDEVLKGAYANMAMVSHTAEEFVVDFMNVLPGQGQGIVASRVIISPGHMKRLVAAIQDNIKRYEATIGKIPDTGSNLQDQHNFGFRTE